MLVYFFTAFASAWFSIEPLPIPTAATMRGEAKVRLIDRVPQSYTRGEYSIEHPSEGDTVLINLPNGNELQWGIIIELYPTLSSGCKTF